MPPGELERRGPMFLADHEPAVCSRYRHWWAELPGVESRVLPGQV
ncbi:hypothetical protein [Streptomyces sp. B1I3]|nr:hypothetical protein [Streptomyces sp. B1I3]MDQ0792270.1 hypothetical protein [Streptomyces sp. B1I3]